MTVCTADFDTGDNIKGVAVTMLVGPQTGAHFIMIGNGDDIQCPHAGDVLEHFLDAVEAITGGSVHVNIGATCETMLGLHNRPLP